MHYWLFIIYLFLFRICRYMSQHNMLDHSTYRKLTEIAISTDNSKILHSTKEEFVQRKVTSNNELDTNTKG